MNSSEQTPSLVKTHSAMHNPLILPKFLDMKPVYCCDVELLCRFSMGNFMVPAEGDRVLLYTVGWDNTNAYHTFDWVPFECPLDMEFALKFKSELLPHAGCTAYEFCYISIDDELVFKSSPFKFVTSADAKSISNPTIGPATVVMPELHDDYRDHIATLRKENTSLRESLKYIMNRHDPNRCERDIECLRASIAKLNDAVHKQRCEISMLKTQVSFCISNSINAKQTDLVESFEGIRIADDLVRSHSSNVAVMQQPSTSEAGTSSNQPYVKKYDKNLYTPATDIETDMGDLEKIPPFPFSMM